MTRTKRPLCYACLERRVPASRGESYFCTLRCAAEWAEELVSGDGMQWCPTADAWTNAPAQGDTDP